MMRILTLKNAICRLNLRVKHSFEPFSSSTFPSTSSSSVPVQIPLSAIKSPEAASSSSRLRITFYQLLCKDRKVLDSYVGMTSSIDRLFSRFLTRYNEPRKLYQIIKAHGGWNNWEVKVLEEGAFNTYKEALLRKKHWFDALQPSMNAISVPYKGTNFLLSERLGYGESGLNFKHSNTLLYELSCADPSLCRDSYIGMTSNLASCLRTHRGKYDIPSSTRHLYRVIRESGGWSNWRITILEECEEGMSQREALARKRHYCKLRSPTLNNKVPFTYENGPIKRKSMRGFASNRVHGESSSLIDSDSTISEDGKEEDEKDLEEVEEVEEEKEQEDREVTREKKKEGDVCGVYCIRCLDSTVTDIFIGASMRMNRVMRGHEYDSQHGPQKTGLFYSNVKKTGGWSNWMFEVLESLPKASSRKDLNARRKYWIEKLKPSLNSRYRAGGSGEIVDVKVRSKSYNKKSSSESPMLVESLNS